jgi:hypothetical protein
METEAAIFCKLNNAGITRRSITPSKVKYTSDHGALYEHEKWHSHADFFFHAERSTSLRIMKAKAPKNWNDFIAIIKHFSFRLLAVDLSQPQVSDLKVVKTFIPGLVPMSFGYREEPCGMSRIYSAPVTCGLRSQQLKYQELNRFPHPYT